MATHSCGYILPGEPHRQRSLAGYSPWGRKRVGHDLATEQQQQRYIYKHTYPLPPGFPPIFPLPTPPSWIIAEHRAGLPVPVCSFPAAVCLSHAWWCACQCTLLIHPVLPCPALPHPPGLQVHSRGLCIFIFKLKRILYLCIQLCLH